MLFDRARGGGALEGDSDHLRMTKWAMFRILDRLVMPCSSEKDRAVLGLCILRSPRPALLRPLAVREPVAIMFCLKSLKAGAEVERSNFERTLVDWS
jgi:hypothetical protein